jgi:hypothetical protein
MKFEKKFHVLKFNTSRVTSLFVNEYELLTP